MISYIRQVTNWVLYPWILTLYPIVYLYSINLRDIREAGVWQTMAVALAVVTVVELVWYGLLRDIHKAGVVTGVMAIIFLTYGHLYQGQVWLMPAMLGLGAVGIVLIIRSKKLWRQLTPSLNMITIALLLFPTWTVIDYMLNEAGKGQTANANPLERAVDTPARMNSPDYPDVYYIIFDGYSSNNYWLREYGYDNSAFTDALESRGFYVAYDSQSNYGVTIMSLVSSLNMRYINENDRTTSQTYDVETKQYLRSLIANNTVADRFKQMGYEYLYFLSGYLSPSVLADENIGFFPDGIRRISGLDTKATGHEGDWAYKQPFLPFFLETTLLQSQAKHIESQEADWPFPVYSAEIVQGTLEELRNIPNRDEATFTFAHIIKPHYPIQFDQDGNVIDVQFLHEDPAKSEYFFEQLLYINDEILALVDEIIAASSVPPIIIIQADHGSDLGEPHEANLWTYYEILNAYYMPGDGTTALFSDIAPVNSFRVVFNEYFNGEYELLKQNRYTLPDAWHKNDYFTQILYTDDRRLNPNMGDHMALIYAENDIFEAFNSDKSELLFSIPLEDIVHYIANPPPEPVLIERQGAVAMYALTSTEFQFNIGPDADGREWAVVVSIRPIRTTHSYEVGD
jgi:hypothetical protein